MVVMASGINQFSAPANLTLSQNVLEKQIKKTQLFTSQDYTKFNS